jgi:Tfp pilus assembly protein PilF
MRSSVFFTAFLLLCAGSAISLGQPKVGQGANGAIDRSLDRAVTAFSAGDLATADALVKKALAATPRNPRAQTLAGVIADKKDDLAGAVQHFAMAAKLSPSAETHNNYGAILLRQGKSKEAAREFEESLRLSPDQLSALVNLARIRFDQGEMAASLTLFERARRVRNDAEIARSILLISLRLGYKDRAASAFQEYSTFASSLSRSDRQELAGLLIDNEFGKEAARELEDLCNSDPADIDALVLLSKAHLLQKDVPAAGKLLESAVARGLDDARIYAALADVYKAGGYFENAIPAMRLAVQKAPDDVDYRFQYGLLLIDSKAPAAAAIRLAEYVKEFPNSAKLRLALGIAYLADGKSPEARECFDKALALDPKILPALAYSANTFAEAGQYEDAAKLYRRGIELTGGKQATFQYLLADTLLNISNSDRKEIETLLKDAVRLEPDFGQAYSSLGVLYTRQGRWNEAATALERAVQLLPDDARAVYQLSRVYARLKRTEDSQAAVEKFRRLDAEQKERRETDRRELVRKLANVRF